MSNGRWDAALRLAAVAIAAIACGTTAGSALADGGRDRDGGSSSKPTQCTGPLGPVTIKGDLVVPTGATCQLAGTHVTGRAIVMSAATLITSANAQLDRDLSCAGTQCSLSETKVAGQVTLERAGGNLIAVASSMSALECFGGQCNLGPNFSTAQPTTVANGVEIEPGSYGTLQGVIVGRDVVCETCLGLDVIDSTIGGSLVSVGQKLGATWATTTVKGQVAITGNAAFFTAYDLTIGGNFAIVRNGGQIGLFNNVVAYNLALLQNKTSEIDLIANRVGWYLICQQNVPRPAGAANTARRIDRDCGPIGAPLT